MRVGPPASKTRLRLGLAPIDAFSAALAPFAALALRDPLLLDLSDFPTNLPDTYQYALVAAACGIASLLFFQLSKSISRFFSVRDALNVCGAVACAVASSSLIVFTFTRLDGVPRSTPLIYGLLLGGCLLIARGATRVFFKERRTTAEKDPVAPPNLRRVILVGVDAFAAAAIKLTDCQQPRTTQVVAIVAASGGSTVGRKIIGVEIVGLARDLEAIIDEYAVHGVEIDEVWLSEGALWFTEVVAQIRRQCVARSLACLPLSEALNLSPPAVSNSVAHPLKASETLELKPYFKLKRGVDVCAAATMLVALLPVAACVAGVVLFDVGAPVLFWQQRLGRNGRKFLLYKFRTYHAPFDREGRRIPQDKRLSKIGRALRATRLDEIPQLYNVLVGDMSLIGPRPLLPQDQPDDPRLRLLVRPGVTGWAQINGGTIVTPEEKDALDVWYIRHASLTLDLKILLGTALFALSGEKMNQAAVSEAIRWRKTLAGLSEVPLNGEASFERAGC